ncbi:uncharacterized protein LOC18439798 isoform X2 [Amborella trichopoda]|uniref:uncharacterized protein LOC18439798 isoform X2 n=1 Tax=Amborella trichopoda TaxID=13333 RepID=UPI0009BD0E5F|nr:uncharacterized protein LOC18439798 isoform X2 [Amborella trichopoda]|eukprot:XP_020526478.1 uncharacterized protein LOC18439798 isoform X2 [Amborella trichopoda]
MLNQILAFSSPRLTLSPFLSLKPRVLSLLPRSNPRVLCKAMSLDSDNLSTEFAERVEISGMEDARKCSPSKSPAMAMRRSLEDLNWDNSFVRELPGDQRTDGPPRQVLHACYTKVSPSVEVDNPELVVWSESVAGLLDLDPKEFERPDFPLFFSGMSPLIGGLPYAQCYGGHQFGMWAGQLGDGRAITLGEVLNSRGERWELQLKGAGKTPYSRFADGLAVLRSSIREFLCSEAMHSLGVATTRALCLVTTGKSVTRDMFYDGNPKEEPGAIVCRVSQSFLRFGSYQIHATRGKEDLEIVRVLADYTIRHHFPHLENLSKSDSLSFKAEGNGASTVDLTSNKYAAWAVEVAERTALLVAQWQGVGFTHGVLNTDNMSILGLTIDYGPFGFLDAFDPSYTPNTTDLPGRRYCFANQPDVGLWNIAQFTATLSAAQLISNEESNYAMERYGTKFMDEYQSVMTRKLGLPKYNKPLISMLLNNMAVDKVDYTNFFRSLSNIKADLTIPEDQLLVPLKAVLLDIGRERKEAWISWVQSYILEGSALFSSSTLVIIMLVVVTFIIIAHLLYNWAQVASVVMFIITNHGHT